VSRKSFALVAQGYPNKMIADVLNISAWTVCPPPADIRQAGVSSRAATVARFFESRRDRDENLVGVHGGRLPDEPRDGRVARATSLSYIHKNPAHGTDPDPL
jgi:hypothetical protein